MSKQLTFRTLCLLSLAAVSVCQAQLRPTSRRVGVSLAGAEFGVDSADFSNQHPGGVDVDFVFTDPATIQHFSRLGVGLLRIPFRWERIQPALGRNLDQSHVDALRRICRSAKQNGSRVLLDVHNYARYRIYLDGTPRTCVIDESVDGQVPVSRDDFADLWRRLALEFRNEPGVGAYGLMNEPHHMGRSDWKQISQHAVDAIRLVDKQKQIVVAGDRWSSAEEFVAANGREAWIRDPSKQVVYEAHCYFDRDGSGEYNLTFREELGRDPKLLDRGAERVKPFLD
jgi:endoglucanase